jgi:hypothetical protein
MAESAVFVPHEGELDRFVATELARGPWDPNAQHGGAPAALLMREFERLDGDTALAMARVTYELLRPVPLGELVVGAQILRSGRRVQLLEGSIGTADGPEAVRARALRVRRADALSSGGDRIRLPGPDQAHADFPRSHAHGRTAFGTDAMDIRFVEGAFDQPGPATAWFRMRHPLVAGEETSPLQRLAAAGDFGNGISAVVSWDDHLFINPDLTLYVEREPLSEWVCLQAETMIAPEGIGLSESVLYDERGRVGRAVQALLVAPRTPTSAGTP